MRESFLLTQVKEYLSILQRCGCLCFRRIHSTGIPRRDGSFSRNTDMMGMEDLQIWLPGGKFLAIELKSDSGRLSLAQDQRKTDLERFGHPYLVAKHLDAVSAKLNELGIEGPLTLRGKFHDEN